VDDIDPRGRLGAVFVVYIPERALPVDSDRMSVIASEAKQSISPLAETWIASSLRSSQ
jgi:hypothetical protein